MTSDETEVGGQRSDYLGVQIRANTKVLRSQAHYNALSLAQRPFEMAIADQSLADLIETSYASPAPRA